MAIKEKRVIFQRVVSRANPRIYFGHDAFYYGFFQDKRPPSHQQNDHQAVETLRPKLGDLDSLCREIRLHLTSIYEVALLHLSMILKADFCLEIRNVDETIRDSNGMQTTTTYSVSKVRSNIEQLVLFGKFRELLETPGITPQAKALLLSSLKKLKLAPNESADFSNMLLAGVSFAGAKLGRSNFQGADLTDTDFSDTMIEKCQFSPSQLIMIQNWRLINHIDNLLQYWDINHGASEEKLSAIERLKLDLMSLRSYLKQNKTLDSETLRRNILYQLVLLLDEQRHINGYFLLKEVFACLAMLIVGYLIYNFYQYWTTGAFGVFIPEVMLLKNLINCMKGILQLAKIRTINAEPEREIIRKRYYTSLLEAEAELKFEKLFSGHELEIKGDTLDLSSSYLTDRHLERLCSALKQNKTVKKLRLGENHKISHQGIEYLCEMLAENDTLEVLDLENNRFGAQGLSKLCQALKQNNKLKKLFLGNNNIGPQGANDLSKMLVENKTLEELDLKNNHIGPQGLLYLCNGLTLNRSLQRVCLAHNKIGTSAHNNEILTQALTKIQHITLELGDNNLNRIEQFNLKFVSDTSPLRPHLSFYDPSFPSPSPMFDSLLLKIKNNEVKLEDGTLDLSSQRLTDKHIEQLCQVLANNTEVKGLNLGNNRIGPRGAIHLGQLLQTNKTLVLLDLSNNHIGPKGLISLCENLPENHSLKTLNLKNNKIGGDRDDKVVAALETLQNKNVTPRVINLIGNNLKPIEQALSHSFLKLLYADEDFQHQEGTDLLDKLEESDTVKATI